jgi:hypothetical protein
MQGTCAPGAGPWGQAERQRAREAAPRAPSGNWGVVLWSGTALGRRGQGGGCLGAGGGAGGRLVGPAPAPAARAAAAAARAARGRPPAGPRPRPGNGAAHAAGEEGPSLALDVACAVDGGQLIKNDELGGGGGRGWAAGVGCGCDAGGGRPPRPEPESTGPPPARGPPCAKPRATHVVDGCRVRRLARQRGVLVQAVAGPVRAGGRVGQLRGRRGVWRGLLGEGRGPGPVAAERGQGRRPRKRGRRIASCFPGPGPQGPRGSRPSQGWTA